MWMIRLGWRGRLKEQEDSDSSFYYLAISVSFYVLVFGVSCD
jgi:hypothetical protein